MPPSCRKWRLRWTPCRNGDTRWVVRNGCASARAASPARPPGLAPGNVQANLVILPKALAQRFPALRPGEPEAVPGAGRVRARRSDASRRLGADLDIRTDLPRYRVWRHGELVEEPTDVSHVWRDDLVSFAIGCSFSFEEALIEDGIEVRHIACGSQRADVPHHRSRACRRACSTGRWWCRCGR